MNQKMRELANLAGEYTDFESGICTDEFLVKFAKLIVKECVNSLEFHGFDDASSYIKWNLLHQMDD